MDVGEAVHHLAEGEARRVRPLARLEDLEPLVEAGCALPYVHVRRDALGRLGADGFGHHGHDNEGRMPYLCAWLQRCVLPFVEGDATGIYRVELHDSYSYLPTAHMYDNALVFSRPRHARESVALLPDPYQAEGYGGLVSASAADDIPWSRKQPTVFFAGTTTGNRDPAKNERIKACMWSLRHPQDQVFMRITSVAQMTVERCREAVPGFDAVMHPPFSVQHHFPYRYQLNIAGNTCCWSRVPMVMASGSLLLHLKTHPDMLWYYPLLREEEHYVGVTSIDGTDGGGILSVRARCMSMGDAWAQEIVGRAHRFVRDYMSRGVASLYAARLFQEAAWLSKP